MNIYRINLGRGAAIIATGVKDCARTLYGEVGRHLAGGQPIDAEFASFYLRHEHLVDAKDYSSLYREIDSLISETIAMPYAIINENFKSPFPIYIGRN